MGKLEQTISRLTVTKLNKNSRNRMKPLIGLQIRKFREQAKIKQADLAKVIGITYQQLQKYESGEDHISAVTLLFISVLLDEPIEYFYEPLRKYLEE